VRRRLGPLIETDEGVRAGPAYPLRATRRGPQNGLQRLEGRGVSRSRRQRRRDRVPDWRARGRTEAGELAARVAKMPLGWLATVLVTEYAVSDPERQAQLDRKLGQATHAERSEAILAELNETPEARAIHAYLEAHEPELGALMMAALKEWADEHREDVFEAARGAESKRR